MYKTTDTSAERLHLRLENRISTQYLEQNQKCHKEDPGYGSNGARWASQVIEDTAENRELGLVSILDYGCGKNLLWKELATQYPNEFKSMQFTSYDPAIPKYSLAPKGMFDFVYCTDVLEHVEPSKLDNVIKHSMRYARYGIFYNMPYRLGNRKLPDGTPCHKTVEDAIWWFNRIYENMMEVRTSWHMVLLPPGKIKWDINIKVKR